MKNIGITCGDSGGIGPEIVIKALEKLKPLSFNPIIIDAKGAHSNLKSLEAYQPATIGIPNKENGLASYVAIKKGVELALSHKIDALVTAPICKESLELAGLPYTGHTTMLKELTNSPDVSMAFYTPKLKTVLATIHKPLLSVPEFLTEETLNTALKNTLKFAELLNIENPKIAIPGFNPHAGENGMFGQEEIEILVPFIKKQEERGLKIVGPIPADTLYHRAYNGEFDLIISLYHDQALIPIKLLHFHDAVNLTLGLPFIRTSPDHGTAFEIAYQNKANESSIVEAIKCAERLCHNQKVKI